MSGAAASRLPEVGVIVADPTQTILTLAVALGLDFVVLDAEQTGLTVRDCAAAVQQLSGSSTQVAVRVPDLADSTLIAFANTGADEIVLPQVRSAKQLEQAWKATRYVPQGVRSRQVSFASTFGTDYSFVPTISVLFETVEAAERIDDFVNSPYFTSGWVGPGDLSADLERNGRAADELPRMTQVIVDKVVANGHSMGLPCLGPSDVASTQARGANKVALYWEKHLASIVEELVSARRA